MGKCPQCGIVNPLQRRIGKRLALGAGHIPDAVPPAKPGDGDLTGCDEEGSLAEAVRFKALLFDPLAGFEAELDHRLAVHFRHEGEPIFRAGFCQRKNDLTILPGDCFQNGETHFHSAGIQHQPLAGGKGYRQLAFPFLVIVLGVSKAERLIRNGVLRKDSPILFG